MSDVPQQHEASEDLAEFEKQLEATLALDPVERLSKLTQTLEDVRADLSGRVRP